MTASAQACNAPASDTRESTRVRQRWGHNGFMPFDIDKLRRRPPGNRLLVYLDQSTLSELACSEVHALTRELLQAGVRDGKLLCPESLGHTDESLGAKTSWEDILALQDELSMGIGFRDDMETAEREAVTAAAEFLGLPSPFALTEEAFRLDPHTPRGELFPGGFRIGVRPVRADDRLAEVAHEKGKELGVQRTYDKARELGRTFDEQVDAEYGAMVNWVLGPVSDLSGHRERLARKAALLLDANTSWELGPGSPVYRYLAAARRDHFAECSSSASRLCATVRQSSPLARSCGICLRYATPRCLERLWRPCTDGRQSRATATTSRI
jgi:hypothetical protein